MSWVNSCLFLFVLTKHTAHPSVLLHHATVSLRTARIARIADQKTASKKSDDITNALVLIDVQASLSTSNNQHILCFASAEERDVLLAQVEDCKSETIHVMVSREIV